jgi:hypothetical protein
VPRHGSRRGGKALSRVTFKLFDALRREFDDDNDLHTLRDDAVVGNRGPKGWVIDGLPTVEDKIFLPSASPCLSATIEAAHDMGTKGLKNPPPIPRHQ